MELYISVDIETDGPIPGVNSMLALGAVAMDRTGKQYGTFYRTLMPIEGGVRDSRTMNEFWAKNPEAWDEVNKDTVLPSTATQAYRMWLKSLPSNRVTQAAYPAGFDFTFIRWYMCKYVQNSWDFSCLDMKTLGMALRNANYTDAWKGAFPKSWFVKNEFPHHALHDALNQAYMLKCMFADLDRLVEPKWSPPPCPR